MRRLESIEALQDDIVKSMHEVILVKGCAGSGKTLHFLMRIAHLLSNEKVQSDAMLNLVYDADTARRMNMQFANVCKKEYKPQFVDMFSFCYRIVQFYDESNGHAQRTVYRDMESAVKGVVVDTFKLHMNRNEITRLIQTINTCKMRMLTEKEMANVQVQGIDFPVFYNAYEKFKKKHKIYDKSDVIHEALHILMYDKEIVDLYRKRFMFITIDDAQEMSYASHMIVRLLYRQGTSLCAFMDESQCSDIAYGAQPALFDAWEEYFGKVTHVALTKNYRMNQTICMLAQTFAGEDAHIMTTHSTETCDVKYKGFSEWKKMYDYALRTTKDSEEETLFLYREIPYAIPLLDLFYANGVALQHRCTIKKFINHPIIKDLSNFITLFTDARNMRAFFDIHEKMGLDMSNRVLLEIDERIQHNEHVDVYQAVMESGYKAAGKKRLASHMEEIRFISTQPTAQMIAYVMDGFAYRTHMKERMMEQDDANLIALYVLADRYPDPKECLAALKRLSEIESDDTSAIHLMDVTACKGQEFSRVCVLDCFANVYPRPCANKEEEKFEKHLFYMMITRAMHHIEFFTSKHCFQTRLEISPYIYVLHGKKEHAEEHVERKHVTTVVKEASLKRGCKIIHETLGKGKIIRVKNGMMEVQFATEKKHLNVKMCITHKLIQLIS